MKVLITAGPTRERIDPIRFLSNRSSGKMGYAIAGEAAGRGAETTLISGPVSLATPAGVMRIDVDCARDMLEAVQEQLEWADALIMVAAVCDARPVCPSGQKLKKDNMSMSVQLEATPDILKEVSSDKGSRLFIGFSAETQDLVANAELKMREKGLDRIIANDVSSDEWGMEHDDNKVTFLEPDGSQTPFPVLPKTIVARHILDWLETRLLGDETR